MDVVLILALLAVGFALGGLVTLIVMGWIVIGSHEDKP
jgi:mannose/fructose/N-acetylgalactosamine-specific phosphotransferase system component IIC